LATYYIFLGVYDINPAAYYLFFKTYDIYWKLIGNHLGLSDFIAHFPLITTYYRPFTTHFTKVTTFIGHYLGIPLNS